MKVAIIGGGAAGFFSAIHAKVNYPKSTVVIFEKSNKVLSKVRVSGGGRCNVTNGCTSISTLAKAYPRGGRKLKKAFQIFNTTHTIDWFESRGVPLYTQEDGRVFPKSDNSQSIIDCLMHEVERLGITLKLGTSIVSVSSTNQKINLLLSNDLTESFDKVIVATGGSPKRSGLKWLEALGHTIEEPIPSLFTFNMPNQPITKLMGLVVENVIVTIPGTKLKSNGPLLITHWGMSGPAILKLSSFGARELNQTGYEFKVHINWINELNNELVLELLMELIHENGNKLVANLRLPGIPKRLWIFILDRCGISNEKKMSDLGKKGLNKLMSTLSNDSYDVSGKTTFKEEFVTCGGISLDSIDFETMQSKVCKNLFFAGEILDIDAITGGYNFQSAWTTGFIAGKLKN